LKDDQLPDYVMIMVTNKKTQKQMTEDLDLFLGGSRQAAEFSAW
jgi:zinc finger CCCH domain-containing protein 14